MGRERKYSREQGDRTVKREFSGFLGGMNCDSDPAALQQTEMAWIENMIPFRSELRMRGGSFFAHSIPSGTVNGVIFHDTNQSFYLHIGSKLYRMDSSYNVSEVPNWAGDLPTTVLSNSPSTMRVFGKELIISTDSKVIVTEESGTRWRYANMVAPTKRLSVDSSLAIDGGNWRYRFLYTYARIINIAGIDTLIQETETKWVTGSIPDDFTELQMRGPISADAGMRAKVLSETAPDGATHIGVYRTLNVGADPTTGISPQNNTEQYYLLGYVSVADLDTALWYARLGEMVIGGTPAFKVGPTVNILAATDDEIVLSAAPLLTTRFLRGIVPSTALCATPGFVFWGDGNFARYSETGKSAATCFLTDPSSQFYDCEAPVKAIEDLLGTIAVCGASKTVVAPYTSYSKVDVELLGTTTSVIYGWKVVDRSQGVPYQRFVTKIADGQIAAVLSDRSVRVFNGTAWGDDLSKDKVSSLIKPYTISEVLFDGNDAILVRISGRHTLRYGFREADGRNWCVFSNTWWSASSATRFCPAVRGDLLALHSFGNEQHSYHLGEYNDTDSGGKTPIRLVFPACTGAEATYRCLSNETNLIASKWYADEEIVISTYADGNKSDQSIGCFIPMSGDAKFARALPNAEGNKLQTEITASVSVYFKVLSLTNHYQVQDRQIDLSTLGENAAEKTMASSLVFHASRPLYAFDRISRTALAGLSLSGDFIQGIGLWSSSVAVDSPSAHLAGFVSGTVVALVASTAPEGAECLSLGPCKLLAKSGKSLHIWKVFSDGSVYRYTEASSTVPETYSSGIPSDTIAFSANRPKLGAVRVFDRTDVSVAYLVTKYALGRYSEIEP